MLYKLHDLEQNVETQNMLLMKIILNNILYVPLVSRHTGLEI